MTLVAQNVYTILLVDDSVDDRFLMRQALGGSPQLLVVGEVGDGEEAISYLSGSGRYFDREKHPFPDIMLLDLKMPRVTGHEVLKWLRTQSFENLVTIVISGSMLPDDVDCSMALGAKAYLRKSYSRTDQASMAAEIRKALTLLK